MLLYTAIFSYLCIMRYASGYLGDPDLGLFDQAFWTTTRHGWLFYNTYELGSHFRIHNSPIFFLLAPFYALVPRLETLLVLQTAAVALGAWPVFLLGKRFLGPDGAVTCARLYLCYHPLHGVNYDQFNELAFAVAPLIFAYHFLYAGRMSLYWLSLLLFLSTKEDMSFVVMTTGLYLIGLTLYRRRRREPLLGPSTLGTLRGASPAGAPPEPPSRALLLHGAATFVLGAFWLWFSLQVVFPHFREGQSWPYFTYYYPHLGHNLTEAVRTILTRPDVTFPYLFSRGIILLFLELLAPLAFLPLLRPALLLTLAPTWCILALSAFGGTHNTGSRYMAPIVAVLFVALVESVAARVRATCSGDDLKPRIARLLKWPLALTVLFALAINTTPVRFPFKNIPRVSAHERARSQLLALIPADASVATQPDLYSRVSQRVRVYVGYEAGVEFILVDPTPTPVDRPNPLRWYNHCHWDRDLPPLLQSGAYRVVREIDGAMLLRRSDLPDLPG